MSRFASADGKPRIFVGAGPIADMANPQVGELATLTDLSAFLTKDGFSTGETGNRAPASGAAEQYNLDVAGSVNLSVAMTFFRDDENDEAWETFERGDFVYVVFFRKGGTGPDGDPVEGDDCEVYYGQVLDKSNADIAENTVSRFTTNISTAAAPEMDAVFGGSSSSS